MTTTPVESADRIRRRLLAAAIETRLETLADTSIYVGETPAAPPLLVDGDTGQPDPSGRVGRYVVLYTGAGNSVVEPDVGDTAVELDYPIILTAVAGFAEHLLDLVDDLDHHLHRWAPTLDGVVAGPLRPPDGYDPGPFRRNDTVDPPRFWTPLQYRTTVTAT